MLVVQPYLHVRMRWMIRRDWPTVLTIEAHSEQPWGEAEFNAALRNRNTIGVVAEAANDAVVGFVVYELHARHLKVVNLAVAPGARRLGVGRQMVERLKEKLSTHNRIGIAADVPESNLAAHLFFKAMGFRAERVVEEAYRFVYRKPVDVSPFE